MTFLIFCFALKGTHFFYLFQGFKGDEGESGIPGKEVLPFLTKMLHLI